MNTDNVFWIFEFKINEGAGDKLNALKDELMKNTEAEEGTLAYEWFIDTDGGMCHVHERYRDSAAAVEHLKGFVANFADRLMALGEAVGFTVYGEPDAAARAILDDFSAVYMAPTSGFAR